MVKTNYPYVCFYIIYCIFLNHSIILFFCNFRLKTALIFVVKPHKECIQDDSVRMPPRLEDLEEFHTTLMNEYQELNIPVYEIVELDIETRKTFILEKIRTTFPDVLK